jgi:hypothetical protein
MVFHGYIRATGDIDLWIRCSAENAEKVWRALQAFGAPLFDWKIDDFQVSGMVFQIGVVPSRIDIITDIDGIEFETAWKNRKANTIDGMTVQVISKPDLILNKKASGRPKDVNDALWMEGE